MIAVRGEYPQRYPPQEEYELVAPWQFDYWLSEQFLVLVVRNRYIPCITEGYSGKT